MSLSRHKYKPFYNFPEELLSEVFKKLPVKYVLRCGAVQKSWYSLIRTHMFITLHSNYRKLTAHINPKYLLLDDTSTHVITIRSDDAHCREYCTFDYPLDMLSSSWYAQSNGLMCLSNMFDHEQCSKDNIYIWNPLVKKVKRVPDSPLCTLKFKKIQWKALAFGFIPKVNDYVVVHSVNPRSTSEHDVYKPYDSVVIGVYSLNNNSWKIICKDKVFVDDMFVDQSVFVNGTAYWVGYNFDNLDQSVVYFDTMNNLLGKIILPERQLESPLILPFGQSIAYFVEVNEDDSSVESDDDDDDYVSPHLDIWVLKDDMKGELSWQKKMSVSLGENVGAYVFGLRNNGEPILAKSNDLIAYDLDTHEPYDFIESCDHLTPCYKKGFQTPLVISPFEETLVLFDMDQ